jgi:aminopeptidase YwaD|tara:strand:- start:2390 stop:4201 length:1812 start_codon:yes stop_codon:yes gene_type:complete
MTDNRKLLSTISIIIIVGYCFYWFRQVGPGEVGSPDIMPADIMKHIRFLADDDRAGRYPGTRQSRDVISYLINNLKTFGVQPGGNNGSYKQTFSLLDSVKLGKNNSLSVNKKPLNIEQDYVPLWFSGNATMSNDIVFAGYGFNLVTDSLVWNDYKDLNVEGKWVMVMRHSPERDNPHSIYAPHADLHKKMIEARDRGAAGILFVSQIEDTTLIPFKYISGYSKSGIPAIHLSNTVADNILKNAGTSRRTIQNKMNRLLKPESFNIPTVTVSASVELKNIYSRAANVVGKIISRNHRYRDEYIIIGAHFDHLGYGGPGSGSLKPDTTAIHNGANDNASGVAGLLELAHKLQSNRQLLKRSILLVGFDAEEKGLLGSKYFIENPTIDKMNIITMINMDMIGKMKDSTAMVGGTGTSPLFEPLLDSLSKISNLNLEYDQAGYGPSDHASFYAEDIPVLFFFTGDYDGHYHLPEDDWEKINSSGEKQILEIVYKAVIELSRNEVRPSFTIAGPKKRPTQRRNQKVKLGIIPYYGGTIEGLKVDKIYNPSGSAAKAGIRPGDIIKSINRKPIKDIYEYMKRMEEIKPGQSVAIDIKRDGKIIMLTVRF